MRDLVPEHDYLVEDHAPKSEQFERLLKMLHTERQRVSEALLHHRRLPLGDGTDHAAPICATCQTAYPCETARALTQGNS